MTIYGVMPYCQGITLHVKHCKNIMLHINHQQKVSNLSRRQLQWKSSLAKVGHFEKWNAHFKSGMGILFFFHHDMSHQISWGFYYICNHCFTLVNVLKMKHFHDKSLHFQIKHSSTSPLVGVCFKNALISKVSVPWFHLILVIAYFKNILFLRH